ncbi:hypothetical protein HN873_034760 [Arachis hypogaea]
MLGFNGVIFTNQVQCCATVETIVNWSLSTMMLKLSMQRKRRQWQTRRGRWRGGHGHREEGREATTTNLDEEGDLAATADLNEGGDEWRRADLDRGGDTALEFGGSRRRSGGGTRIWVKAETRQRRWIWTRDLDGEMQR